MAEPEIVVETQAVPDDSNITEPLHVLLVDDSVAFRERLARSFRERGYEVSTAGNYDEGMEAARSVSPDMAVVDLRMPGESGLTLVRDLKQLDSTIRILVLSGFGSISTAIDAVRLGSRQLPPQAG